MGQTNKNYVKLCHDLVELLWRACGVSLERLSEEHGASEKSQVLNHTKGLLGAGFHQIPVSIVPDFIIYSLYRTFLFCGRCDTGGISPYRTCLVWMQHRWIMQPDEGSPDVWPRTPFFTSYDLTALFWCAKIVLLRLLQRRDVP